MIFIFVYPKSNMILWSIRTFWYKGSAENKGKQHVRKKSISLKNSSLKLKVIFSQKLRYDVNMLILVRYDIIFNI